MKEFIAGQHGDPTQIDHPETLPQPKQIIPVPAGQNGYVQAIHAEEVGICAMKLGAGRATKEDSIDHAVGIMLHKKVGDAVQKGESLASLYVNDTAALHEVKTRLQGAIQIGSDPVDVPKLIRSIVTSEGVIRI
jgi:pyrimidine-nucleoside phosphorylase